MAEKEGFEPSYGVTHNTLSKRAVSTTHPPLRIDGNPNSYHYLSSFLMCRNWLMAGPVQHSVQHDYLEQLRN